MEYKGREYKSNRKVKVKSEKKSKESRKEK